MAFPNMFQFQWKEDTKNENEDERGQMLLNGKKNRANENSQEGPDVSKNGTFYKEVKCKVQRKLRNIQNPLTEE